MNENEFMNEALSRGKPDITSHPYVEESLTNYKIDGIIRRD